MSSRTLSRRKFLGLGGLAAAAALLPSAIARPRPVHAQGGPEQRFLFTIAAFGGASLLDSFLPVPVSAVEPPGDPSRLIAYPDAIVHQPAGSNLRCISGVPADPLWASGYDMGTFLDAHYRDMVVLPATVTSVNHIVAQHRAVTGAGANAGRTIMEAMAERHGTGLALPNCTMAAGGYSQPGDDPSLSDRARAELIADPVLFAASTHGYAGVPRAPGDEAMARARRIREQLDEVSHFGATFSRSDRRRRYLSLRREVLPQLEATDLIRRLMLLDEDAGTPLSAFGLSALPREERDRLLDVFPRMLVDPLHAQGALAFLLARYQVSCSITIGPNYQPIFLDQIYGTPLAFDYSHTDHVASQSTMWGRILEVTDGLIRLLKEQPYNDDPSQGSIWERSLVYVATDFGRDKERPRDSLSFGTGHHLNNGNVLISPLLHGNRVWGGIDRSDGLTFGDRGNGVRTEFREQHVYAAVAHAMDIDYAGREDMGFMVRT